jgi:hypothetical protein
LELDGSRLTADVLAQACAALIEEFGWERRSFGQPVSAAEVTTTLMHVLGVVAVAIEQLYTIVESGEPSSRYAPLLPAARASLVPLAQAELLLINPAGIDLRTVAAT